MWSCKGMSSVSETSDMPTDSGLAIDADVIESLDTHDRRPSFQSSTVHKVNPQSGGHGHLRPPVWTRRSSTGTTPVTFAHTTRAATTGGQSTGTPRCRQHAPLRRPPFSGNRCGVHPNRSNSDERRSTASPVKQFL